MPIHNSRLENVQLIKIDQNTQHCIMNKCINSDKQRLTSTRIRWGHLRLKQQFVHFCFTFFAGIIISLRLSWLIAYK